MLLALTGDIMLGRGVEEALAVVPPEQPWGNVLPLLQGADLRIVNLECALTRFPVAWRRTFKVFHFGADPARALPVLRAARIDICSLANNHTLDFEVTGLTDTLAALRGAGIAFAGAGRNAAEAEWPAIVTAPSGERVAVIAATDNEPSFAAGEQPGTNYLPVSLAPDVLARVDRAVLAARDADADVVVFSNHWGPNMVERPPPLHRAFAHAVIDRGVDIYHGHSAHLVQGVEIYRGRPILYDTGDFLDDYRVDPVLRNDWSFLFRVRVEAGAIVALELWPVVLTFAQVNRAVGAERGEILGRMIDLSAELGTRLQLQDGRLGLGAQAAAEWAP